MYTITENNVNAELLNSEIMHVTFQKGGHFSTQLIRELSIFSKIQNGTSAKAYILTLPDFNDFSDLFDAICRKADRFEPGTLIAVVGRNRTENSDFNYHFRQQNTVVTFENFLSAISWVKNKLNATQPITQSLKESLPELLSA